MNLRTYLSLLIKGCGKGPITSLFTSSSVEDAHHALPSSYFSSRCLPRMQPWQTTSMNLMFGRPCTIPCFLNCCKYLKFKCPNLSCQSLLYSFACIRSKEKSSLGKKWKKEYNLAWWSTSPTTTVEPSLISKMTTEFGVNTTFFRVPEWVIW